MIIIVPNPVRINLTGKINKIIIFIKVVIRIMVTKKVTKNQTTTKTNK